MSGQKASSGDPRHPSPSHVVGRRVGALSPDEALAELGLTSAQAAAEGWYLFDLDAPDSDPAIVAAGARLDEGLRRIALVPLG